MHSGPAPPIQELEVGPRGSLRSCWSVLRWFRTESGCSTSLSPSPVIRPHGSATRLPDGHRPLLPDEMEITSWVGKSRRILLISPWEARAAHAPKPARISPRRGGPYPDRKAYDGLVSSRRSMTWRLDSVGQALPHLSRPLPRCTSKECRQQSTKIAGPPRTRFGP